MLKWDFWQEYSYKCVTWDMTTEIKKLNERMPQREKEDRQSEQVNLGLKCIFHWTTYTVCSQCLFTLPSIMHSYHCCLRWKPRGNGKYKWIAFTVLYITFFYLSRQSAVRFASHSPFHIHTDTLMAAELTCKAQSCVLCAIRVQCLAQGHFDI